METNKIRNEKGEEVDQDGGVRGHGAHLPPCTHQKYIYVWKVLTEN